MADEKLTALTALDAFATGDLLYTVDNPGGTPLSKKATIDQAKTFIVGDGSVSIASGKTLTGSNTLTLAGTDATTMTFPATSATLARTDAGNTFTGAQTITDIANPLVPSLSLNAGSNITGTAITGVQITGTAGQFSCTAATLSVGQLLTISGTLGGTGSISGYANPTTYRISVTNGSTTFTLVNNTTGAALTTTAGTPTGLTYTLSSPGVDVSQTWNNTSVAFTGLRYNVTDTASNAASLLMDLQTNTGGAPTSRFSITKNGFVNIPVGSYGNSAIRFGGSGSTGMHWSSGLFLVEGGGSFAAITTTGLIFYGDTILSRRGAANLRLGAADAATPVAQTLSVQGRTGTDAAATAYPFTIQGAQGTGTGAGGSIVFQVAPAGTAGSTPNGFATALTINSTGKATFAPTANSTNSFEVTNLAGSIIASVDSTNRRFNAGGSAGGASLTVSVTTGATTLYNAAYFGWMDGSSSDSGTTDVRLYRDDANKLALRNGTNAQEFRVYNTFTDASNYERGFVRFSSNRFDIGTEKAGTGAARELRLFGSQAIRITPAAGFAVYLGDSSQVIVNTGGNLIFASDNNNDVGLVSSFRPRSIYAGTSITPGAGVVVASLPTPSTGMIARVTDATAPVIGATVTGGGAAYALVNYNGANWTVIGV
jgi:hypothetical protein